MWVEIDVVDKIKKKEKKNYLIFHNGPNWSGIKAQ